MWIITGPKLLFYCILTLVLLFIISMIRNLTTSSDQLTMSQARLLLQKYGCTKDMKYILQWTSPNTIPFIEMMEGQETFKRRNCKHQNCFVTSNTKLLNNITMFDIVAFHGPEVRRMKTKDLPQERSPKQKYVFACIESSHYYPMCETRFNRYFNWTWTYKLDSDEAYGYITIKDKTGEIIGPNQNIHWMSVDDMKQIDDKVKDKLKSKTKVAAWMVSNCNALSKRERFVKEVQRDLAVYGLEVDVYGKCGTLQCPDASVVVEKTEGYQPMHPICLKLIETDYYFYFSLENSFAEDYVTEKLLHALQNYAIPVVYGGANYSRFMPNGMYLNGKELGAKQLAALMHKIINDKELYYNYFKWRNHYSYHAKYEDPASDDYCEMCRMANDEVLMTKKTVYDDFRKWWNPPGQC